MLKNIKSFYILKIIFSFTNEKQKLDLIKYNKSLQEHLNISLINYKYFTGKYIEYESNGKGKEYFYNGKLIFEDEYLNGKRNGKGKEYSLDGKLIFEGEYLNGKRNGKGKEYDDFCNLRFEGEYLNGKRNGKRKKNKNNKAKIEIEYFGEFRYNIYTINNEKDKLKVFYEENKLIFEGEYLNWMKNGKGKEYYFDGKTKFEGIYLNDKKWEGKGYDKNNNIVYELKKGKGFIKEYNDFNGELIFEGEYLNGKRNGKGKEYEYNGNLIFEGEYLNGKRNGKGKEYNFFGELEFEGEYLNRKRHGKGKEYYNGELIFEGEYLYGYRLKGKYYINERLEYEGEYLFYNKYNGKGFDEYGNIIYELKNGNGNVKEYYYHKLIFEGEYLNGKRNDKGKEYYNKCKLKFEDECLNRKKNGC